MRVQPPVHRPKQRFIATYNFANGTQLCLVRENSSSKPKLLFWNGSTASIRPSFKIDGRLYKPIRLSRNLLRNLRLPVPPRPYGSVEKLVERIGTAFQQRAYLQADVARLLACCCIATWFPECLELAPCLSITSPVGPDRILILRLLSCFCRHAVVLGQASAESLLHVAPGLQSTLLIHYAKVPPKVQSIVNAGCYRGTPIPQASGEMIDAFGVKVVAASEPAVWLENAVNVAIPLHQNGPTASWDDAGLGKLASEFQGQLLSYRLERLKEVAASDWDVPKFLSPVREIARSLGRCLCSGKLREDLVELLRAQEEELRAAWSVDDRAIAVEALLLACHAPRKHDDSQDDDQPHQDRLYVGEAAEIANGILKLRGEKPWLTARRSGELLRGIGLPTRRLDKAGRGWRLDEKTREKIHELAKNYGARSINQVFEGCPHCRTFAAADSVSV
jgi:hypothetical protein